MNERKKIVACAPCLQNAHRLCAQAELCFCRDRDHKAFSIDSAVEAELWRQALARHYGEPVMPVGRYCAALGQWARVAMQSKTAGLEYLAQALHGLELAIRKSNLLYRLIYNGEQLRTEPCPEHAGRWSGAFQPCDFGCASENNLTGWLPNASDFRALQSRT